MSKFSITEIAATTLYVYGWLNFKSKQLGDKIIIIQRKSGTYLRKNGVEEVDSAIKQLQFV
jgi:hypothetical protein